MGKIDDVFSVTVVLTGIVTAVILLVAPGTWGLDPVNAMAAFGVLAATRYAVKD